MEFKLQKDKNKYIRKQISYIILHLIFLIICYLYRKSIFEGFSAFLIFFTGYISLLIFFTYDNVSEFIKIDSIEINENEILRKKNGITIDSSKITDLAIYIYMTPNGFISRTFFDLSTHKKLFSYLEEDVEVDESKLFLNNLVIFAKCDYELLLKETNRAKIPIYNHKSDDFDHWSMTLKNS